MKFKSPSADSRSGIGKRSAHAASISTSRRTRPPAPSREQTSGIVAALPARIKFALGQGASVVRSCRISAGPDGQRHRKILRSNPWPLNLGKLLGEATVAFAEDCVWAARGRESRGRAQPSGDVLPASKTLQLPHRGGSALQGKARRRKLRRSCRPERRSRSFMHQPSPSTGDVYVNDAFGTAHRAHSSMVGVKLPVKAEDS